MNYFRHLLALFVFLLFVTFFIPKVHVEARQTYRVTAEHLNIRTAPSGVGEILGILDKGNKVTVFQEQSGWMQTFYNGKKAWVRASYLAPIDEKEVFLPDGLLSGYTIVIDPGHGGKDPGAIGDHGELEKDLILDTCINIRDQLEEAGATVILTRDDDSFISLQDRVTISNKNQADAFISIHFNAFKKENAGGFSTYYHRTGKRLAHTIQQALSGELKLRNRGVFQYNYHVLRDNNQPAILIELGFITNTKELTTLQTEDYQARVARAIEIGLIEYFWN